MKFPERLSIWMECIDVWFWRLRNRKKIEEINRKRRIVYVKKEETKESVSEPVVISEEELEMIYAGLLKKNEEYKASKGEKTE